MAGNEGNQEMGQKKCKAQPLRGAGNKKTAHIKGQKMDGGLYRQAFRPRRTHEQQVDFGRTWKRGTCKAQTSPACIQPI